MDVIGASTLMLAANCVRFEMYCSLICSTCSCHKLSSHKESEEEVGRYSRSMESEVDSRECRQVVAFTSQKWDSS